LPPTRSHDHWILLLSNHHQLTQDLTSILTTRKLR
jgi:hypothetical protein